MRIVVIASTLNSLINFRGALLQSMFDRGYEVHAFAPRGHTTTLSKLTTMGVAYHEIDLQRTNVNALADVKLIFELRNKLREINPSVVLGYTIKPVIYGSIAAKMANVPNVFSMITGLGYAFTDESKSLKRRLISQVVERMYRYALKKNQKVFFQNPDDQSLFLKKEIIKKQEDTVLINGSGVDLSYFAKSPLKKDPITFLLIARLLRDKGIIEYVEAARKVKELYPHIKFNLVGPFDSNPTALSKDDVHRWHAEGIINYLGPTDDVRPFIADSSVYVLPSYREGTPRTVLEAMAMGRPIITTDAPGCRETVVDGHNGFLVPVRDASVLAEAMEHFIKHPDLIANMGEASLRLVEEKYDVHKVNEVILHAMGI